MKIKSPVILNWAFFILGHDLAGVVVGIGNQVNNFKVGDEVYAKTDQVGAFAEFTTVKQTSLGQGLRCRYYY